MLVSFRSGGDTLRGYLHRPEGNGPFPAIAWNHGSERSPGPRDELGEFYTSAGYVLFVPHRRGHGRSPGEHLAGALRSRAGTEPRDRIIAALIELHELHLQDVLAAANWLWRQPFVDASRMAMSARTQWRDPDGAGRRGRRGHAGLRAVRPGGDRLAGQPGAARAPRARRQERRSPDVPAPGRERLPAWARARGPRGAELGRRGVGATGPACTRPTEKATRRATGSSPAAARTCGEWTSARSWTRRWAPRQPRRRRSASNGRASSDARR